VGTYYNAPSPESSPYISIGQEIKEGEVVCIVEAMKVMNEIRSPKSGVVKKIHVKNESMVEYGQPLIEFEAE
jgi:acetyl-CoA carboxylase biotin carboxyl carrier protein